MRPIRHERQVHGLLRTIKEDHEFAKSTHPKEEPLMKDARTGRQHNFDPLWYPELISMAGESLDSMDFDTETITIFIYCERHTPELNIYLLNSFTTYGRLSN